MIKKYVTIVLLLVICQAGFGQMSVSKLFKEFSKAKDSNSVNIGKITMSFASFFTETMGVDGVEIFSFDECAREIKDDLTKAAKELKDPKYETMLTSNENNSRTKVLVKLDNDIIRELVVVTTGDSNALIRIKGKIKPSDIERIVNKHSKDGQ